MSDPDVTAEPFGAGDPPVESVRHYMLGDQIKDRLLTWIMEGDLPPGSRIVETRIARELGISQGPVREALRDLATLGLVELQPYRGARVRMPTIEEHLEAIVVRGELEALAAREVAGRLTEAQVDELRRLNQEMRDLATAGDLHGHAVKNTEFHATIVRASGNQTLQRVWAMVQPFAQTYLTVTVAHLAPTPEYVDRHAPILEALIAGDPEAADEAMREHGRANAALIKAGWAARAAAATAESA